MPYILKADYPLFDLWIDNLTRKIKALELSSSDRDPPYLNYYGYVFHSVMLKIIRARRYWTIVDMAGTPMNVVQEMERRLHHPIPYTTLERVRDGLKNDPDLICDFYEPDPSLDADIEGLAKAIVDKHTVYGYDGAYNGLYNYSMTTLALKLIKNRNDRGEVQEVMLCALILMHSFYDGLPVPGGAKGEFIAALYEDEQIAKPTNGDVY